MTSNKRRICSLIVLAASLWLALRMYGASDIYFAASPAGSGNGSSCPNARALSSHVIGDDVAGNTLHICPGTITGAQGATAFTTLASGSLGSPITLKFETGAVLSSPAWGSASTGAITIAHNFWTVDGGTNGVIQNTLDGTAGETTCLGGTCTVQQAVTIAVIVSGTNATVQNLHITHMCMHTWNAADGGFFRGNCVGVSVTGDGSLITQNTIDNTATGVALVNVNTGKASFNSTSATSRSFVEATTGTFNSTGPVSVDHNHISAPWIWDSADNQYHHNGFHVFTSGAGQGMNNVHFSDNLLDGVWSKGNCTTNCPEDHTTAGLFINDAAGTNKISAVIATRNVFAFAQSDPICLGPGNTCPASTPTNSFTNVGICTLVAGCTPANNSLIANNTMIGLAGGGCWHDTDASGSTKVFNNLCATNAGGNLGGTIPNGGTTAQYPSANVDSNLYPGVPASNAFTVACATNTSGCNANSWAVWHATPYFLDVHCNPASTPPGSGANCNPTLASANLGSNFRPGPGSTAIGAATNLTSLCGVAPELCKGAPSAFGVGGTDDGVALPATGNWDAGAYQSQAAAPAVSLNRTLINFGPQNTGTSSANVNTVVTNTGTANLTVSSVTVTGTDAANYSVNTNTCTVTVPAGGTCSFNTVFTPGGVGTFNNAFATVTSNAATSPNDKVTLNGTGQAPITVSISVTPSPIAFGNQIQGVASAPVTVTVKSIGTGSFTFGTPYAQIVAGGVNPVPADFGLAAPGGTPCSNGLVLAPAASCTFTVTAILSQLTLETALLNVNGPPNASVNISGTGLSPQTAPAPAPAIFVNYPSSRTMDVTVTNCLNPCKIRVTCASGCSSNAGMAAKLN